MTFDELIRARKWIPIRNCPGRYKLAGADPKMSLEELLEGDPQPYSFKVAKAKDLVLVVPFDKGGVISYQRADGSFVHTLNSPEGFARKLDQLGIDLRFAKKSR